FHFSSLFPSTTLFRSIFVSERSYRRSHCTAHRNIHSDQEIVTHCGRIEPCHSGGHHCWCLHLFTDRGHNQPAAHRHHVFSGRGPWHRAPENRLQALPGTGNPDHHEPRYCTQRTVPVTGRRL